MIFANLGVWFTRIGRSQDAKKQGEIKSKHKKMYGYNVIMLLSLSLVLHEYEFEKEDKWISKFLRFFFQGDTKGTNPTVFLCSIPLTKCMNSSSIGNFPIPMFFLQFSFQALAILVGRHEQGKAYTQKMFLCYFYYFGPRPLPY